MSESQLILRLNRVHKNYITPYGNIEVLKGVDLSIYAGEFVALTGPSGSGKSTFLHLSALLDVPSAGKIVFDGSETSALGEADLSNIRKNTIGMVFQDYHLLLRRTVLENVLFRFRYLDRKIENPKRMALDALETLGLSRLAYRSVRLLSGGEMQRTAIARAMVLTPKLLVADEPTGNLDAETTKLVMQYFTTLNQQGITILLVTHNTELLKYCSRHLVCRDGFIV